MNSKEEILKKHCTIFNEGSATEWVDSPPKRIYEAMTEYRSIGELEAAIGFATWMEDGNFYRSVENGIRYYHKTREEKYTKEQLYEIYKQSL